MANLNLSQFGENTSVSDADYTFVWDSAASISKKVSRNSWLNSGTLASDAPVTISQTWNNAAVTFTGLKVNAVSTASASGSLLLDLQVGGVTQASVSKSGNLTVTGNLAANGGNSFLSGTTLRIGNSNGDINLSGGSLVIPAATAFGWANTLLVRDGADNTLALRNGAAAQTFNIYNTYQNAGVDYERIAFKWSANLFTIGREFGGTGGARNINIIGGGSVLGIGSAATAAVSWTFSSNHFLAGTHNAYDIGASGANSPRDIYAGGNGIFGGLISAQNGFRAPSSSQLIASANGIWRLTNSDANDFNRLQLGGTTNSFPAIKRSSTTLQARLADDSAFAPIQGKLTTDTAFTATTVTPTGFITLYDSTGTAYKVPCVPA